jgi:hypothetical protein
LKLWVAVLEQGGRRLSEATELRPQSQEAPGLASDFGGLSAVISLWGGSWMAAGLSARGLGNVEAHDWSNDFTFVVGHRRAQCRSAVAQFLSPQVAALYSIDATISELRLEVEDGDLAFDSLLEAAGGSTIAQLIQLSDKHLRRFDGIQSVKVTSGSFEKETIGGQPTPGSMS